MAALGTSTGDVISGGPTLPGDPLAPTERLLARLAWGRSISSIPLVGLGQPVPKVCCACHAPQEPESLGSASQRVWAPWLVVTQVGSRSGG